MSRAKSPEEQRAFNIWCESGRTKKPAALAAETGVSASLISKWKSINEWVNLPDPKPKGRGAPQGNKNAKGNKGGPGGPDKNDKAVKHGFFRKFEPQNEEYLELFDAVQDMDPLEMLWYNVTKCFQRIVWGNRIFHVESKEEMIKEIKKQKFEIHNTGSKKDPVFEQMLTEVEYEFQFSWDRYVTAIKAEAVVMREFRGAAKQFLSAAPDNDERRLKLEVMKLQAEKLKAEVKALENPGNGTDNGNIDQLTEAIQKSAAAIRGDR